MDEAGAPTTIVSTHTAEHYRWGGKESNESDGWYLLCTPEMDIIEERMPSGANETRHFHNHSRQFFYVLEGELRMEVEGHVYSVKQGHAIEIAAGQQHKAGNAGLAALRILVVSRPPSHGDRTESP